MSKAIWTKQDLANSINQRVDRGQLRGDLILSMDISDEALKQFQDDWELIASSNPTACEPLFTRVYQSIISGF